MSFNQFLLVGLGIGILALIAYAICWERTRRQAKRRRFAARTSMTTDEIYEKYFGSSEIDPRAFAQHWLAIGQILHLDAGKLRPTDRFDKELSPVEGTEVGDELEDLSEYFEEVADKCAIAFDAKTVQTIDDLMRIFCQAPRDLR